MFSYQCRYCKVNFDQWEKLVTHRRDEHREEFEALKRRFVLLHGKREEVVIKKRRQQCTGNREHLKGVLVTNCSSTTLTRYNRMKPTSTSSGFTTPLKCNQQPTSSKELDAKDLENQEISLRIPSSTGTVNHESSPEPASPSSSVPGNETPPFCFLTPTSSPSLNRNALRNSRGKNNGCVRENGHRNGPTSSSYSFITPPVTPTRLSSPSQSALQSEEELALNMNWSPPVDLAKAVQYHQMSDDSEIEIYAIPSNGPCISVTKHFPANGRTIPAILSGLPAYANRTRNGNGAPATPTSSYNRENLPASRSLPQQHQQPSSNGHVVVENLEDEELRMTCSMDNSSGNGIPRKLEGQIEGTATVTVPPVVAVLPQQTTAGEGTNSTGQRLQRLHSQLKQTQKRKKPRRVTARDLADSIAVVNAFGVEIVTKRIRPRDSIIACSRSENSRQRGRSNRSSSSSTSTKNLPNLLRLNTRASPRRPK